MKKIILFTGTIDSSFFLNEIEYLKKEFEIIKVFTYHGDIDKSDEIAKKYNFTYKIIPNLKLSVLFSKVFFKWIFSKEVVKEIFTNFSLNKIGINKIKYILFYGHFCIASCKEMEKTLEDFKDESIYLYSFWLSRGAYSISYYKSNYKKKLIIKAISRAHRYDLYEERNKLNYLPFREYINNNLDKIYFISEEGREYFKSKYKFEAMNKYFISKLGTENIFNLRKEIKDKQKICIASCSHIVNVKRLDLIIDILSQLDVEFLWIHIGAGEIEDQIKEYACKKLNQKNYRFLGKIDNSKILQIYIDYDVDYFINLSDSEGIPVSIMEANSLGIPVVTRNVGGNSEIVEKDCGLLLNGIDIELIKEFFNLRLKNENRYKELSINSLNKWKREYNAQKNYIKFFRNI